MMPMMPMMSTLCSPSELRILCRQFKLKTYHLSYFQSMYDILVFRAICKPENTFQSSWLQHPDLSKWLVAKDGNPYCKICSQNVPGTIFHLLCHGASTDHQKLEHSTNIVCDTTSLVSGSQSVPIEIIK